MNFDVVRRNVEEAQPTWEAISFAVYRKGKLRKMLQLWDAPPEAFAKVEHARATEMDDIFDRVLFACKTGRWDVLT